MIGDKRKDKDLMTHKRIRAIVAGATGEEPKPLSWKPRRRGPGLAIYCAPACGGDCRLVDFRRATELANRLAKRLTRWYADNDPVKAWMVASMPKSHALRTWAPVVHENLGWHWHVKSPCQQFRVFKSSGATPFSAWFEPPGLGQFIADAATPEAAIEAALDLARKQVKGLGDALALATQGRKW